MNFKGISAPLNAGRLEQMLSLAQPRRVAETQDANDKASGSESVHGLEVESCAVRLSINEIRIA
ncbi:hypothetical protein [Rhizobium aouanii]